MKEVTYRMVGNNRLVFGRPVFTAKKDTETHEQFEERTWMERCNVDSEGDLCLSATQIHRSLITAGAWLSMKLSGNKTYTKRFESGLLFTKSTFKLTNGSAKPLKPKDCERLDLFVPSDGKRGGSRRVMKHFPCVWGWSADVHFIVTDDQISDRVLASHLKTSGVFDGMGSMRVGKGNGNGSFHIEDLQMSPMEDM